MAAIHAANLTEIWHPLFKFDRKMATTQFCSGFVETLKKAHKIRLYNPTGNKQSKRTQHHLY